MSKEFVSIRLMMLLMLFLGMSQLTSFAQTYKQGVLEGTFRIKLQPTLGEAVTLKKAANNTISTGITALDRLNQEFSVTEMKRVFRYSPKFEERHKKHGLHLWYEITITGNTATEIMVSDYAALSEVEIAEPILEKKLIQPGEAVVVSPNTLKATSTMPFNDPYLPQQWHYDNTGQTGGTPGADIRLFNAWDITTGTANVIVSIHDMGIDTEHEDLNAAMFVNEAELNGTPDFDDDGNGYRDDIYGFNFSNNTGTSIPHYHGTHVAGTIGAVNNNGIGVSGVAGGSGTGDGVRILPCQIMGGTGSGNIADSYVYATDMGAVISQNSWGYASPDVYDQVVLDAIDYFIAEAGNYPGSPMKGGIVFFAAGNKNVDDKMYPGYYDAVITVSALDATSNKTGYSNYGQWVDISAPGGDGDDDFTIGVDADYSNGIFSTFENDSYGYLDGTSMACPHVSGVAALVVSKYGSDSFTNEDLKTHLLTGVREDIYEKDENQAYLGLLGVGATDAFLSLAKDNGTPPETINDLSLSNIAQDFATMQWTVPSDPDDGIPYEFEIIYSTEVISTATLSYAKTFKIRNRNNPSETISVEVSGLQALTEYNFAVRGIDRWENISNFSNILTAITNAGPDAELEPGNTSLDIVIDVTVDSLGTDSFKLFNYGEGLLRWDALLRHATSEPLSVKPPLNYPTLDIMPLSAPIGFKSVVYNKVANPVPLNVEEDNREELHYIDNFYNFWLIGETDTSYTNSAATHFYVENTEGFNLTHVDAVINHDEATGPIILEIYTGQNISDAKLMLAQEIAESPSMDKGIKWTNIELTEQIFLEHGIHFWVVYHVPTGNEYPLGASYEANSEDSKNCYLSTNLGQTWGLIEDVYYDNQIVWSVVAMSNYLHLDEYIVLNPNSGDVLLNDSVTITALVNGAGMVNGTYQGNIVINTNETEEPMLRIPVNVTVKGHLPNITSVKRTDFGSIIYGNSKTAVISFKNEGLGKFYSPVVSKISDTQFEYLGGLKTMQAGDELMLAFKYTPSAPGTAYAKVTLTDTAGVEYSFELVGVAAAPPIARLNRQEDTFTNLTIGDTVNGSFYLVNDGTYPLDYFLPNFADGANMVEVPKNVHKYGYIANVDANGVEPAYQWEDIAVSGTNIIEGFSGDRYTNIYQQVDLGFEFNFFGEKESSVFISKYGLVSFDTEDAIGSSIPMFFKYPASPNRFISAWGLAMWFGEAGFGDVYYQRFVDKFIVQYDSVPYEEGFSGYATFQIVLHDNGNINIYYKDVNVPSWNNGSYNISLLDMFTFIAIEDQNKDDGLLIHSQEQQVFPFTNGSTIELISPGQGLYKDVDNPYGTISQNDSILINYALETADLYVDNYTENLVVITNDPFNNPAIYSAHLEINAGGVADVHISDSIMDFGQVFQNDVEEKSLTFINTGKATDSIVTAVFDNDYYYINGTIPEMIKPGRTLFYTVGITTPVLGTLNDTLRITTKSGNVFKLALSGEIISGPEISLNPTSITTFIAAGSKKTQTLTVENAGAHDLDVAFAGNDWLTFKEKVTTKSVTVPEYTYSWTQSDKEGGPVYNWIEIAEGDGIKLDSLDPYLGPQFTEGIELPFTFNYYGNEYDTVYIGYSGLISFTPAQEKNKFYGYGGKEIPNTDIPNNYIAPLWVGGGAEWIEAYPFAGQYYRIDEDKLIVEYRDYNNGFGMGVPISFQVIIYANGNILFQYKIKEGEYQATTGFGVIGVENIDGSEGVMISHNQKYVDSDLAILLTPEQKHVVPAGGSKDFDVTLDASILVEGEYIDNAKVINNSPAGKDMVLPVTLYVSGDPEVVIPDSIYFGDLFITKIPETHIQESELKNIGTADYVVTAFQQNLEYKVKFEVYVKSTNVFNGEDFWEWQPLSEISSLVIKAKSYNKMRVSITPIEVAALNDTLFLTTDVGNFNIPIIASTYKPPVVSIDTELIEVYAEVSTHTEAKTFVIDNIAGGYSLNYDLSVEFDRQETATKSLADNSLFNIKSLSPVLLKNELLSLSSRKSAKSTKANYNRVLAHDNATSAESTLGYGGGSSFHVATAFNAPGDGFNLTHVQTWYVPGDWLNGKITAKIYGGNANINNAELIHTQDYTHSVPETDMNGELITIELTESIVFYPNEIFFIEFVYDAGANYPQGVVSGLDPVENRYLYGNGTGWNDIVGSGFDDYGWFVRAVEESFASAAWVTISSGNSSVLKPGESNTVSLNFDATFANPGENKANLHIKSNDSNFPDKIVKLVLRKNQGPLFDFEDLAFTVNENDTLNFKIAATDLEGDSFTLNTLDSYPFINTSVSNNIISILCTPDYGSAGIYNLMVEAEDSFGNKNKSTVQIDVINQNRQPEALSLDTLLLEAEYENAYLANTEIFADPDDDELLVVSTVANDSIIELFSSDDEYIIKPLIAGETDILFKATDVNGDSTNNQLHIIVDERRYHDDDPTSKLVCNTVFSPNGDGINDTWTIETPELFEDCTIRVLNDKGQEVFKSIGYEIPWDGTFNGKTLNIGTYYYVISCGRFERTGTIALIK